MIESIRMSGHVLKSLVCLADMETPNCSALYVNPEFERCTGYSSDEVLGRNFRFLQGELTSNKARQNIREAISKRQGIHQDMVNYRRNGEPFWNRMVLLPLQADGHQYYMGIQHDVTAYKNEVIGTPINQLDKTFAAHSEICHFLRNPLATVFNIHPLLSGATEEGREAFTRHLDEAVARVSEFVLGLPWSDQAET